MPVRHARSMQACAVLPTRPGGAAVWRWHAAALRLVRRDAGLRRGPPPPVVTSIRRVNPSQHSRDPPPPPCASIRLVEPSEGDMQIPYPNAEAEAAFTAALADPALCADILAQAKAAGKAGERVSAVRWVPGAAFVPQPWSPASPRGVPLAWDGLAGRDDHVVIQVPPPVTYKCRVPGRAVAIYELVQGEG